MREEVVEEEEGKGGWDGREEQGVEEEEGGVRGG